MNLGLVPTEGPPSRELGEVGRRAEGTAESSSGLVGVDEGAGEVLDVRVGVPGVSLCEGQVFAKNVFFTGLKTCRPQDFVGFSSATPDLVRRDGVVGAPGVGGGRGVDFLVDGRLPVWIRVARQRDGGTNRK